MACGGRDHILLEIADGLHFIGQLARLQAAGKRDRLIAQSGLRLGQQLGDVGGLLLGRVLVALLFEGGGYDFLLPLRDLRGLIALPPPPPPPPPPPACCDCENSRSNGSAWMNIMSVWASALRVLGGRVDAHQIAGNQLEIFQRNRGRTVGFFRALLLQQIHGGFGAAVDRIMQRDALEAVFVGGLGGNGHLFDGAGVISRPGPGAPAQSEADWPCAPR